MRKTIAFALVAAGIGSAAYLLPEQPIGDASRDQATGRRSAQATAPAPIATALGTQAEPRVFSPGSPLISPQSTRIPAAAPGSNVVPNTAAAASVPAHAATLDALASAPGNVAATPARRLSSSRPADGDARQELVRDLQRELKRVGCYDGEINGAWTASSKRAMAAFTERVNATLPLDEPDYILLTLVQGHGAQACGRGCPTGQGMSESGKCLPRAVLAQSARRNTDKTAAERLQAADALVPVPPVVKPAPKRAAAAGSISKEKSAWSTIVTASPQPPAELPWSAAQPAPLPGRMTVGAREAAVPADASPLQADPAKREQQFAPWIATIAKPAAGFDALQRDPATQDEDASSAQPQGTRPADVRQGDPAYRAPPPRLPPSYATGAIASPAPRPTYSPAPARWTRTIFNDVTRMR